MPFIRVLFFSVFAFLATTGIQAQTLQLELTHQKVETAKPDKSATTGVSQEPSAPPVNLEETISIELAPPQVMVRDSTFHWLYDFDRQTVTLIEPQTQSYFVTSLYAHPAFKEMELRNRVQLARFARERGFEHYQSNQFELEMMLGSDPNSDAAKELTRVADGGRVTYRDTSNDVVSFSVSDQKIPSGLADTYRKLLLHYFQIHPTVIEDLVGQRFLFETLNYSIRVELAHLTDVSYSLVRAQAGNPADLSVPEGFERRYGFANGLDEQIRLTRSTEPKTIDAYVSEMRGFLEQQKFVEAFLVYREFFMQFGSAQGTPMESLTRAVFEKAPQTRRQVDVRTLSEAIQTEPNDLADLEEAIAVIEQARSEVTSHTHVLDVFIANFRAMIRDRDTYLGEKEAAAALFFGALQVNPHLAGVYHDLGHLYFDSFQMQDAWHSWDEMRRINPDHPLAAGVADFENRIRTYQASYFN